MREKVNAKQAAVEEAKSAAAAAESGVRQAQAELEQAKLNRSYTKIYAPISGHVTRKSVEAGAVRSGRPALAGAGRSRCVGDCQFQGDAVGQDAARASRSS